MEVKGGNVETAFSLGTFTILSNLDFCLDGFKTVQNLRYLEDTNLTLEVGIHVFDFMLFL